MLGATALAGALFAVGTAALAGAQPYATQCSQLERPRVEFRIKDPRIAESSGLAASRRHRGIVYTHNDSGGAPELYALDGKGRTRATLTVAGAENRDWEGMAVAGGHIYIGDIGDNVGSRRSISVYRVKEPASLRDRTVRATRFRFKYKGGPRDAESLLVHQRTGRIYIADKSLDGALYEAPRKPSTKAVNSLRRVADAPPVATGGAFAPVGSGYVIRTYLSARLYKEIGDENPVTIELPRARQGESITYTADGKALLTGSEGKRSKVWRVPLTSGGSPSPTPPLTPAPAPAMTATPAPSSPVAQPSPVSGRAVAAWTAMGVGAIGIIVWLARRNR